MTEANDSELLSNVIFSSFDTVNSNFCVFYYCNFNMTTTNVQNNNCDGMLSYIQIYMSDFKK